MNVCIPCVINQGDVLGISQEQGQHLKQDMLINTAITATNEQSCQPNICGDTTKYALRSLSNLGIKQIQVTERCMWQYNKTWIYISEEAI
jgi:hypothetical protein